MKGGKNSLRIYRDNVLIFLVYLRMFYDCFLLVDLWLKNLYFFDKTDNFNDKPSQAGYITYMQ